MLILRLYFPIFFILFGIISECPAQTKGAPKNTFTGTVLNQSNGAPLPFATVSIKGTTEGTISNQDGKFSFLPNAVNTTDTLQVSHIGYKSIRLPLLTITDPSNLTFELTTSPITLEEITIEDESLTAYKIMDRVFQNLGNNYPTEPFVMNGFFRDLRTQNDEAAYLVEAGINVYDQGIMLEKEGNEKERRLLFLEEMRSAVSQVNPLISTAMKLNNFLYYTIEYNWLKNLYEWRLDDAIKYKFDEVVSLGDQTLYVITRTFETQGYDNHIDFQDLMFIKNYQLYVDAETYAIHKVAYSEIPIQGDYTIIERPYEGDSLFWSHRGWNITREYGVYQGKMYPRYIHQEYPFHIVDRKNDNVHLDYSFEMTFMVNDVVTDQVKKPKGRRVSRNKSLYYQSKGYQPDYWKSKKDAQLIPLTSKQLTALNAKLPLTEQYLLLPKWKD